MEKQCPIESRRKEGRFLKNFLSLSAAEATGKALSFAATVHLARVLGAEGFGILGFCTAFLFYFMLIVSGGFDLFGIREINRNRQALNRYVENILTMRLLLAALAYGLLLVCSLTLYKTPAIQPVLRLYGLTLFSGALSFAWAFQAVERVGVVALGNICTQLIFVAAVFITVRSPADVWHVPVAQFIADAGALALLGGVFFHKFGALRFHVDRRFWRFIFTEALPIGVSLGMSVVMLNLDAVILGFMRGPLVVGWYSAAYRIVLLLLGFSTLYHINMLPMISQHGREHTEELKAMVTRSLRLTGTFAVPIAVGGTLLARPLMGWIYGPAYDNGVPALQIIIWSVALTVIRLHYRNTLFAFDEQKLHMKLVIWGAVINTVLNLLLIPKLSLVGAAIATVCSEGVIFWKAYAYVKQRVVAIPFLPPLVKPLVAALVMAVSLAAQPPSWHLFLQLGAGAAVYFTALFLLNGISLKEMQRVFKYVQTR